MLITSVRLRLDTIPLSDFLYFFHISQAAFMLHFMSGSQALKYHVKYKIFEWVNTETQISVNNPEQDNNCVTIVGKF